MIFLFLGGLQLAGKSVLNSHERDGGCIHVIKRTGLNGRLELEQNSQTLEKGEKKIENDQTTEPPSKYR